MQVGFATLMVVKVIVHRTLLQNRQDPQVQLSLCTRSTSLMFINTSVFFTVALAAIATAVPTNLARGGGTDLGGGNCNANALCCDNVGSVSLRISCFSSIAFTFP